MTDPIKQSLEALRVAANQNDHDMVLTGDEIRSVRAAIAALEGLENNYALVPKRLNAEMRRVLDEDSWDWAELLAAAEAITEDDYEAIKALEGLEKAEPVAWVPVIQGVKQRPVDSKFQADELRAIGAEIIPLYTHPAPVQAEPSCNPHPKAPHGFNRNSSHSAGRYVCDCEHWEPYQAGFDDGMQAQSAAPVQAEPSGWKLVPVEPTPEMVAEYLKANDAHWRRTDELPTPPDKWRTGTPSEATAESYRAMLNAAPQPAAQVVGLRGEDDREALNAVFEDWMEGLGATDDAKLVLDTLTSAGLTVETATLARSKLCRQDSRVSALEAEVEGLKRVVDDLL